MKAFWWFKENLIAGMARPGFNSIKWFDLPFDEAVMIGWLGQHSVSPVNLDLFRHHLQTYVPRIYKFHQLDEVSGPNVIKLFDDVDGVVTVLKRLNSRIPLLSHFEIVDNFLYFTMNEELFNTEIEFLKQKGIRNLISLTELQHHKVQLQSHFNIHHISIQDLGAPKLEQARQLAEIVKSSLVNNEKIVVHCMAGIGRTSTMLMAAHILLGEKPGDLKALLAKQNPSFTLWGPQADFIRSME